MSYPHVFEPVSKLYWHFTVVVSQEIPENKHCCDKNTQTFSLQIFQDDISVVVCFEEPVGILEMVFVKVAVGLLGLVPKAVTAFLHLQANGRQTWISLRAHEEKLVTASYSASEWSRSTPAGNDF